MSSSTISRFTLILCALCISGPVFGAENHADSHVLAVKPLPDSGSLKRRLLAQDFVARLKQKKIGAQNDGVSAAQSSVAGVATSLTKIAVGTEMQFRPRAERVFLDNDVYAIVGETDFYLLFSDLIAALNFPITMDDDTQSAKGWFLREDWSFYLDVKSGQVRSRGQDYVLAPEDFRIEDNEVFIASKKIGAWLGMDYKYDVAQQYMEIISEYPLPIVTQIKRRAGQGGGVRNRPLSAQLPRQDYERKWLDVNVADLSLRTNYYRPGENRDTTLTHRGDVFLAGEALKHDAFLMLGADNVTGLNSATARLSRTSDDPELLGFMRARSYMIGDIETVNMPLLGSTGQELGFRVSSNPLSSISYQNTQITGYALPGWDVELYRGTSRLGSLTVDDTGRYAFNDVQLFSGDNDFDVFFYGSQGEIRRETLNIPLNAAVLSQQANTYDVSVSLKDSHTYRRFDSDRDDADTLHLAGQYKYNIGNALAYTGLRLRSEDNEQKIYLGSGLTTIVAGTILDANIGVDDGGETSGQLGLRRTIADWRTAFVAQVQSDGYSPGDGDIATTLSLIGSTQRDFHLPIGSGGTISFDADYREFSNNTQYQAFSFGLSQGFSRVSVSNALRFDTYKEADGSRSDQIANEFTTRARWTNTLSTRTGVTYMIRPDTYMDRYFANINYNPSSKLNFDVDLEHKPQDSYSQAEFRANYTHQRFRLSPFLRYDSDRDLSAGFNISTSLIDTPQSAFPLMTSERMASQGMVSALVYLDVNGNMKFDDGDEKLPDALVESVNSYRREKTNENGYALLTRLSTTIATDIRVVSDTLPDAFMVTMNPGNSILPRPGVIYEMEFPVQFASEIDGTVLMNQRGKEESAKFVEVVLLPLAPGAEPITAKAAQDGFYIVSMIPPGQYYMTVSGSDMKTLKASRPMPQLFTFSHAGDSIYAQNLVLQKDWQDIQFTVLDAEKTSEVLGDWSGSGTFIRLPQVEKGGLLNLVHRLRMRDVSTQVTAGLSRYDAPDKDGVVTTRYVVPGGLEEAWARCEIMARDKLPCAVDVVPNEIAPAAVPVTEKVLKNAATVQDEKDLATEIAQH